MFVTRQLELSKDSNRVNAHRFGIKTRRISIPILANALTALCLFTTPYVNAADQQDASAALSDSTGSGEAVAHISIIDGNALGNASGLVRVNLTAGDGNVQQNSTAAAHSTGISVAAVDAHQYTDMVTTDGLQLLSAEINDQAFGNAQGIIQVNQSAGAGNAQFNGAALAIGELGAFAFVELNDEQLMDTSNTAANGSANNDQPGQVTSVGLAPGAFKNATGIIQINQAAGNNNISANSFTMTVSP